TDANVLGPEEGTVSFARQNDDQAVIFICDCKIQVAIGIQVTGSHRFGPDVRLAGIGLERKVTPRGEVTVSRPETYAEEMCEAFAGDCIEFAIIVEVGHCQSKT